MCTSTPGVQRGSPVDAANRWNTTKIRADGPRITIDVNGVKTVDGEGPWLNAGPHRPPMDEGDVRFRNVKVRRLD